MIRIFSVLALLCVLTAVARADEVQIQAEPEHKTGSITISPVHLVFPVVEVTGEVRLAPKVGLAFVLGVGRITDRDTDVTYDVLRAGSSVRWYASGSFDGGLQFGAEALFVKVSTGDAGNGVSAIANGLSLGPFVGWKWVHHSGFTFDGQLGITYLAYAAEASNGGTADDSRVGPLLNLNVGWSF